MNIQFLSIRIDQLRRSIKHVWIGIALLVLVSYDSQTSNQGGFRYTAKVDLNSDELAFQDIVADYKYIKLEVTDKSILGTIRKVEFYQSRIYTLTDIVHCFDQNGKFLFSIDKKGRGPEEFTQIMYMSLDDNRIILTAPGGRINIYRSDNGDFIKSYNLGFAVESLVFDGDITYMDRGNYAFEDLNKKGTVLIGNLRNPTVFDEYLSDQVPLFVSGELTGRAKSYYFNDPLKNQIYKFANGTIDKYIQFDFGAKNPTKADINAIIANQGPSREITNAHFLQNFSENKSFASCVVTAPPLFHEILFDKESNKCICWDPLPNKPRLELYQFFPFMLRAFDDDYFYGVIEASRLVTAKDNIIKSGLTLDRSHPAYLNYKIVLEADVNDNQIIALYKFKRLK